MEKWSLLSLICDGRDVSNFFSSSKELTSSPNECPPWCKCKCQALPFPKGNPSSVTAANLLVGLQGPHAVRATSDPCDRAKRGLSLSIESLLTTPNVSFFLTLTFKSEHGCFCNRSDANLKDESSEQWEDTNVYH